MGEILKSYSKLAGVALALAPVGPAVAADISAADNIIVTATRTETAIGDSAVPVTVISRDDIELSLATDLAELLRFEAGLDIARTGGPGQATSLFLRGTESNHTLILVDGVRINPGTLGGAALQNIAPEVIERVEIVKGARSALYGSDAIGGVVNIITRKADRSFAEGGVGGGSFNSWSGNFAGAVGGDNGDLGITLNYANTDGFPTRVESDVDRGYDNLSVNAYGSRTFGNNELSFRYWQASGTTEYLDFFLTPVSQDYRNSATALQLNNRIGEAGLSQLIVSYMADDIEQREVEDYVKSSRTSIDWQYTQSFQVHTLTGGIYIMEESASSLSFGSGFNEDTRVNALFLQDQIDLERQRILAALRVTDHDAFGTQTTGNLEYSLDVTAGLTLSAGLGRAFRAPDATDRFGFGGNPNLEAETSDQAQLGARFRAGGRHLFGLDIYANDIDNLIDFDMETFTLDNIAEAEIRGAELSYEYTGDSFNVRTSLVNQRAEDKASGARLLRRADESLTVTYTQNLGRHRAGISLLASGDREDFGGVELDSYVLVNLTGEFALSRNLTMNLRVENLTDEEYETAANFRMQERSAFLELRYRRR